MNILNIPYRIKHRISNFVRWFPIIWHDEDWDHYYIYAILHKKLQNMKEFFNSDRAMASKGNKEAKKIKICVDLLDRLMKDEYHEGAFKRHDEKWGQPKFNWIDINKKYCELKIERKNIKTEEDKIKEKKEFHNSYEHERNMRKQDIKYLFDYIAKHIEGFWD